MDISKTLDEGTYLQQGGEIRSWEYFTRFLVAANTTVIKAFTAKLGDAGFTREDQTNLELGGQMPQSQRLDIKGIAFRYQSGAAKATVDAQAILAWLSTTVAEFNITDKIVMLQKRIASFMGLTLPMIQNTGAVNIVLNTVQNHTKPVYMLERKIILASQTPYRMSIRPGVAALAQQATDVDFVDIGLIGDLWSKV